MMFISDVKNNAASSVIGHLKEDETAVMADLSDERFVKRGYLSNTIKVDGNNDVPQALMRPLKENEIQTTCMFTSIGAKVSPSPSPLPSPPPSQVVLSSCGYRDHYHDASVTDETLMRIKNNDRRRKKINGWQRSGCGGSIETFPFKLHEMLKRPEYEDMLSWQPHGRCFMIHKVEKFVEDVLPKFFNQSKFRSFQRQLNMYGFRRLRRGVDRGGYYHELFLKGREDLCRRLIRSRAGGKKGSNGTSPPLLTSSSSSVTSPSSNGASSDDSKNYNPKKTNSLSCAASLAKATVMEPNFYAMEFCRSSSSTEERKTNNVQNLHTSKITEEHKWQQQEQQNHHQQQQQGEQYQQSQRQLQQAFSIDTGTNNTEEHSSLRNTKSMEKDKIRSSNSYVPLITPKAKHSSQIFSHGYNDRRNDSHYEGEELYFRALSSNFHDANPARKQEQQKKFSRDSREEMTKVETSGIQNRTPPLLPQYQETEIVPTTFTESEENERMPSLSASSPLLVLPQIDNYLTSNTVEENGGECRAHSISKPNTSFVKDENNEIANLADELPLNNSIFDEEGLIPTMNVTPSHSSSTPPSWEDCDNMLSLPYPFNDIYNTSEVLLLPS